ncbi:glycosyltransferase family 2 protein [Saccharopolyspora taberi]|uniref:Glycosyltransferase family 2 protein n=1 Tax=Saccharopolyspora taberi TaxID=60895 RepID=A0ABN3V4H5_9PSEU
MPRISVVTAAYGPTATFLSDTIESVKAQALPPGWELEWVVQEDGPGPFLATKFDGVDFVRYEANEAQLGLAMTRNLALSRVTGDLVQVLDHDDVLLPDAFTTLIPRFATSSIHWAIGQADDLLPDGSRASFSSMLDHGVVPAGRVNEWAADNGGNWPVHCAGLMMRTATLRALGGWAASPADDDLAMFAALSEVVDGYNDPALTWLYRQHPNQTHKKQSWNSWSSVGRRIALQRAAAVRAAGLFAATSNASSVDGAAVEPPELGKLIPKENYPGR